MKCLEMSAALPSLAVESWHMKLAVDIFNQLTTGGG